MSFVGGVAAKIVKKYGLPNKWAAGVRLIKRLSELIGKIIDGLAGIAKGRGALRGAKAHLDGALRRLDDAAQGGSDAARPLTCSFSAETAVLLVDGTVKAISEVEAGDHVLAEDPETGQRGGRLVTHTWVHGDTLVDLVINGATVTTTEDHPFWNATDGAWQPAEDLDRGDAVRTAGGRLLLVDGLLPATARTATAYNLAIDDVHTYFVSVGEHAVLVHNSNSCPVPGGAGHADIHQFPGIKKAKSQFFDDVDLDQLADTSKVAGVVQSNKNVRYVMRAPREIGVDRATGLPTDIYTVSRRQDGTGVTMFPGTSRLS